VLVELNLVLDRGTFLNQSNWRSAVQ